MRIRIGSCAALLSFGLLAFSSSEAAAQEMAFLASSVKDSSVALTFDESHAESEAPGDGRLVVDDQRGYLAVPVWKREKSVLSVFTKGDRLILNQKLTIPETGFVIPEDFGNLEFGASYVEENDLGEKTGGSASLGYSGRRVLEDGNHKTVNATVFTESKSSETTGWIFLVNYSNNRTYLNNVPIPGVAYMVNGKNYRAIYGLPFIMIFWRPTDLVMTNFFISPFHASAEASYFVRMPLQVFTGLAWAPRAYQNLVPEDPSQRLFYDKQEWTLGLRLPLGRQTSVSAAYSRVFGRRLFVAQSLTDKDISKLNLGVGDGFAVKLKLAF